MSNLPLQIHYHSDASKIIKEIQKTILTWRIDININEYNDFCKQFDINQLKKQEQERELFKQKSYRNEIKVKLKLLIDGKYEKFVKEDIDENIVFDNQGHKEYCDYVWVTVSKGDNIIHLNTSRMAYELQDVFTFSTMKTIYEDSLKGNFKDPFFVEKIAVEFEQDAIVLSPEKVVDIDQIDVNSIKADDYKALLCILQKMMNTSQFRLQAKSEKKNSDKFNRIVSAGEWKDASQFTEEELRIPNCIYYLIAEPVKGVPTKMYIGEAKSSGGRLTTKTIDGKVYIGHSERPDDFNLHKFCKYRIDQVCSLEAMHDAQDAMIGAFNMADNIVFPNGFVLTNKMLNKAYSNADKTKKRIM